MLTRPGILIRLEHGVVLLIVLYLYRASGSGWGLFALLFLWPDLGMLGYLANVRIGSALYNLVHLVATPAVLAAYSYSSHRQRLLACSLIWLAHIEWDRALGFGLKYPTFFKDTHLQRVTAPTSPELAKASAA